MATTLGDLRIIYIKKKEFTVHQRATSALGGQQLDRPSKELCGPILHKWVNQNVLDIETYESSWKSSHARPLNAGNNASRASTSLVDFSTKSRSAGHRVSPSAQAKPVRSAERSPVACSGEPRPA